MTKGEFLQELRIAMQGRIPQAHVNEHLRYYETYIMEESRKGRTEEQVIESLGDPRLIAKTIRQTTDSAQKETAKAHNKSSVGSRRIVTWIVSIACLFLLISIGLRLLPVLLSGLLIGAIVYAVFLIFFGNKK